ncbi:major facilitator superfamily domain-containing protein, partial [Hypoxylon fragiforme]|uniref:major facilitator superfamily domain-containing protein n=1 Tax=Hypoxylon fragiforme TaxID=63214 RepID=UPI0020C6F1E1
MSSPQLLDASGDLQHNPETDREAADDHMPLLEGHFSPTSKSSRLLLLAGPALLLITFVNTIDLSYVAANYSRSIADDLNQVGNASWLVTGYLITESAFQPMYAQLSSYHGHKMSLVAAALFTTFGLFLCSLSQNLWQLAISRAFVGLGAAGLDLLVLIIINDLVDLYSLPLWRTVVTVVSTVASFLGPSIGAVITDATNFRFVFGLEFILMLVGTIGIILTLRPPRSNLKRVSAPKSPRQSMDYVGAGLLLLAVAASLLTLDLGGQVIPWSHPVMIFLYIATPALTGLFFYSQIHRKGHVLVPLRFLRKKSVVVVFACGLPAWLSWDQLKYGLGQYVQARSMSTGSTSAFSDWALSCVFLGIPLGSFISGVIIRRYRALKPLLRFVAVLNLLTYLCFTAGWIHPENPAFTPVLLLVGLNVGVLDSCWLVSIFSQASPQDQPSLYAFFDLGRANTGNFGIAVALASTNAMIRSSLESGMMGYPNKEEIIRKSLESFSAIREFPPEVQRIVLNAYISSSEKAFGISCCVLIISVIAAFYIPEVEHVDEVCQDDRI